MRAAPGLIARETVSEARWRGDWVPYSPQMSTARCAVCSTLRPANASYCPNCGSAFPGGARRPTDRIEAAAQPTDQGEVPVVFGPSRTPVDFSVWAGVKLGVGFVVGTALFALIFWLIVFVVLGMTVSGLGR